eukprot:6213425-Pleurochrysis_carterae.AAC.1
MTYPVTRPAPTNIIKVRNYQLTHRESPPGYFKGNKPQGGEHFGADPTRLRGRPAVWSTLARRPSLRDWAGRGGRRPPVPTPSDRVFMPQGALSALCGITDGRVGEPDAEPPRPPPEAH